MTCLGCVFPDDGKGLSREPHHENVKNASYSRKGVSKCVLDRHSVKEPGVDA